MWKRLVGGAVAFAIVLAAPGHHAHQALAQTAAGRAAEAGNGVRAVPSIATGLSAPSISLAPTALGLTPSVLSAPSIAPAAMPAAVGALAARPVASPSVEIKAVALGPVQTAAAKIPPAAVVNAPAALAPVKLALERLMPAASIGEKPENMASAAFDGASEKKPAVEDAPVAAKGGFLGGIKSRLAKGVAIVALAIPLALSQNVGGAKSFLVPPVAVMAQAGGAPAGAAPNQAAPAQAAPVQADSVAKQELPRPVVATAATFSRQGMTVGERLNVSITIKNTSDKPITLHNLRTALQESFPQDLELQGRGAEAPLTLAPGETKTITYEAIPFGSGKLSLEPGVAVVETGDATAFPKGIEIVLPKGELEVKTVLTPDWKDKGLRDIVGPKRADGPNWMWLAAIPLGLLLLVGVHRLVAARKLYPKLDASKLSIVVKTEHELERLRAESESLDSASFHARYQDILTEFMVDFAGMPKAARDARTLARDLRKTFYDAGQVNLAGKLALDAENARFSGAEKDAAARGRDLDRLKALVESVAGKAGKPAEDKKSGLPAFLALAGGAAGLQFGSPWVLLLLIPYFAYVIWSYRARGKDSKFAVSSTAQTSGKKTLRERLSGLPKALRMAAIGMILVALARPMIGTEREETFIPSTDTMVSIDLSGSMSGAKLENVKGAVKAYVEEQRRGTENRVGMVTFSDKAYLDVKLTTDYDALIAHLQELQTTGSTAVGKSMLTAIAHFAELNALELDAEKDPRVKTIQKLLKDEGLAAALAFAKDHPDLMEKILQPERAKIVVVFTDGESNSGISPQEAAQIAAKLGVKVYTVGIGDNGRGYDSKTLRDVADITGAKFYMAGDADGMRDVLLDISRLEKSPAKIVSAIAIKDYTSLLALLAFLMLGAEVALSNTRLRKLYGMAFLSASLLGANVAIENHIPGFSATQVVAQAGDPTKAVPPEMLEGNRLYNQGRYGEALKKYGEALERHPDVPELYFNMADAYLRLGQNEKADAAWQKYLSFTQDPKRQSQTLFNLGNSALEAGDAEKAMELYKEALRRDSANEDAKWNLEALKQAQKEQQQNPQKGQKGQQGKQKGQKQKGDKGDQKGDQQGDQQGDQEGDQQGDQSGDQQGDKKGDGKPKDGKDGKDPKEGADKLGEALGQQEKGEKDAARKAIPRKGSGVWGMAALPLAFAGQGVMFSGAAFAWVLGIGLPLAVLFILWGLRKNMAGAKKLAPVTAPKNFAGWWGAKRFLTKAALILSVLGLTGLASMDPRGGMTDERVNFGGKDIVVTVDGSTSMVYAEDGRMARTQKELNEFISRLQGTDRVGLVFFAGKARTASPVSAEYSNFEFKINRPEVETRDIGAGSNLGDGVKYAAEHFEVLKKLGDRQRLMIVISDGDVPEADVEKAIAAALEHKVTVYVIGVGDPAGTKIKIPTEDGKGFEYQIDEKTGQPATTRLVEAPLRKLAERTGGAYFRSGGKTSIDAILKDVSALEKGQQGDTIKSPRPIGVYLLWPALMLLLLDSILKGKSFLRRPQNDAEEKKAAKDEKGKGSGSLGGPASFLGLALIPLGAWPQILPFAILATLAAGYLAYDHWTGGALTRRITETWQRWNGAVPKGVAKDLVHLYDLREADERRLSHFVAKWQAAKEPLRETMIDWASRDEALWREFLTAAYLSGAAPETMDKILAALRRAGKTRMEPLTPITERILARRADIGWLSHSDSVLRVEALEAVAASKPVPYEIPSLTAPRAPGLGARLKRWGTVGVLSLMIALTGVSSIGTIQFQAQQRQAAEASMRLFYAEDLFIFTDRYVDARIPEQVLPALKRWHESPRTAGGDLERALQILRESPDPKADNVLVAIFRRAGILPLTAQGEAIMLRSLIERDNDMLWASMDQIIAASRSDEGAAMLLVKLVVLGVESGNEKTIVQLFRVLKSPNRQVQQMAGGVLYSHLSRDGGKKFFAEIAAVQDKHVNDPALQLWSASFVFRRLGDAAIQDGDLANAKTFLDKSLTIARAYDALRKPIWEATPPDQEVKGPPSMVVMLLNIGDRMQGDGNAPAPLQGGVRYLITQAITEQIKEAETAIPGLHERLIAEGVVLPDTQSGGGYDDYYDDHGHGGYYGRGGSYTTKNYRELYKLGHLQAFAKALEEMGGPKAEPATKENAATRELMDRAMATVEKSLEAGAKAGMMQGGSAPELAADDLWETIKSGQSTFSGEHFMKALRTLGLAPAMGDHSSRLAYAEALDAAQLATLRDALVVMAKENKGWETDGKTRPLTWAEKIWLSAAIEKVEAVRAARFPSEKALDASNEDALLIAKLSRELTAKGDSAALDVEAKLFALAGRPGFSADDANALVKQVLASVKGKPAEAVAVDALVTVLKTPNGAAFAPAARERAADGLKAAAEKAEAAFAGLKTANILMGARESEYGWRGDLKLRHYQSIIDGIAEAENKARAAGKLTPEMKAVAETARNTIASYKSLAALAGASAGDSLGEIAADEANVVLLAGYRLFTASEFNEALRAAKLMPGAGNNLSDYRQTYTKAELEALRAWLVKTAAGGKSLGSSPRDLTWNEKVFLTGAIDRFDEILAKRFGGPAATKGADLKAEVMRPGQESLALVRLTVALKARAKDAGFAVRAQDVLIEILKSRPNHDSADVAQVLDLVSEAVAGTTSEKPQLEALLAGLQTPAGKLMAEAASERAAKGATEVGEELEKVLDKLKDANVNSGAREDDDSWREPFTLRHYRELRAASDSAMAKVKKPSAEQRKAFEKAKTLLPLYERIAAASGVAAGDDPAEISAELLNNRLQKGYTVFPGSTFTEKLRAMGLMDSNGAGYGSGEYRDKYSKADVVKLKTWLEGIKKSGKGWEGDGTTPRDLTDAEAETIDEALRAADRALAAHEGKKTQHAFSPLMLAALPVLGAVPLLLFAAVGVAAAFVVWRMLSKAQAKEEEARLAAEAGRDTIEAKTLARHRRIELSARRLATAVSGGSFRSRFIGAGGTEFAEARPYENEDAREIDWKTSAKKDELYAKKFELERDMPLMLVVDVSKSGRVGTTGVEKRAAIQDAAAVIALAATRHNVRVGLILVSDRVETVIPPKGGQKHAMQLIEAILKAEAQGQTTDLKPGLDTAGKVLVSRSMVAVVSDFISADFKDALGSLAARHDVRPIRVSDPAELKPLPDVGLLPVEDAETGTTRVLDTSSADVRREQAALISRREQMIETAFEAARLRPIKISTEGDPLESLELALQPKAKQPKNP